MPELSAVLDRLAGLERSASRVYARAAGESAEDRGLRALLRQLSDEEEAHALLMEDAAPVIKADPVLSAMEIEEAAIGEMEAFLALAEKRLAAGRLSPERLVECMVSVEASEWNRAFLGVIGAMTGRSREFIRPAAGIQRHKRSVERFLLSRPGMEGHASGLKALPDIWRESILLVDDDAAVTDVVSSILSSEGRVDTASNGAEALSLLERGYYAAILSDMEMPVMDGREFFKRARMLFPGIEERFIFLSSDGERLASVRGEGARCLVKPSSLSEISSTVAGVLDRVK